MTKAEIVNEIAKKTGIEKSVVLTTVESFMDVLNVVSCTDVTKIDFLIQTRKHGSLVLKRRNLWQSSVVEVFVQMPFHLAALYCVVLPMLFQFHLLRRQILLERIWVCVIDKEASA